MSSTRKKTVTIFAFTFLLFAQVSLAQETEAYLSSELFEFGKTTKKSHWFLGQMPGGLSYTPSGVFDTNLSRQVSSEFPETWGWQLFPNGLIFPSFLAGVNESRIGGVWNHDDDLGWIWDITLGGRAPLLRYGNRSAIDPEGWQFDLEGSVHLRLDLENEMDMDANDFRFGLPISYGTRTWQIRFGYYHVSSHLGDERILRLQNAGIPHNRINYYREALIFGYAYHPHPDVRLYAEADFAVDKGECTKHWHFQFGAEYAPKHAAICSGFRGSPFAAVNVMLLEEHDFDGNITAQIGWQWRGSRNQIFRAGIQYFGGVSEQYEHIHCVREHKIGLGLWYDF